MRTGKIIDIVVVDKSPLVQDGLSRLFDADERFNLVATASDGVRFMDMMDGLSFDIAIIGWDMPSMTGREVMEAMRDANPDRPVAKVVVYTGNSAPDVPRQVMGLNGAGFCSKSEPLDRLVWTLIAVSEGRMVFPLMDMRKSVADSDRQMADPFGNLTPREQELLGALSHGYTNAQIAADLNIKLNTIKYHLKNLYSKLNVKNRTQAVAILLKYQGV